MICPAAVVDRTLFDTDTDFMHQFSTTSSIWTQSINTVWEDICGLNLNDDSFVDLDPIPYPQPPLLIGNRLDESLEPMQAIDTFCNDDVTELVRQKLWGQPETCVFEPPQSSYDEPILNSVCANANSSLGKQKTDQEPTETAMELISETKYDPEDRHATVKTKSSHSKSKSSHTAENPKRRNSHSSIQSRSQAAGNKCSKCSCNFSTKFALQRHQEKQHNIPMSKTNHRTNNQFECNFCGKKLKDEFVLRRHQAVIHDMKVEGYELILARYKNPVECGECGKILSNTSILKTHQRTHSYRSQDEGMKSRKVGGCPVIKAKNTRKVKKVARKKGRARPKPKRASLRPIVVLERLAHLPLAKAKYGLYCVKNKKKLHTTKLPSKITIQPAANCSKQNHHLILPTRVSKRQLLRKSLKATTADNATADVYRKVFEQVCMVRLVDIGRHKSV